MMGWVRRRFGVVYLDGGTRPNQHVLQTDEKYHEMGTRCKDTAWMVEIRYENADAEAQRKVEGKGKGKR